MRMMDWPNGNGILSLYSAFKMCLFVVVEFFWNGWVARKVHSKDPSNVRNNFSIFLQF